MVRRVFYSFYYEPDNWRAAIVRNIGSIEGNTPVSDNNWEAVKAGGNVAIKKWISDQMVQRTCTVVLVGSKTADRKWINYEICKSWNDGLGVVGIRIHGLKDSEGKTSWPGANPFDYVFFENSSKKSLSSIVKCYDPPGHNSQEIYDWISNNLSDCVEEAIRIRKSH